MTTQTNEFGQPVGEAVPDWKGCQPPPRTPMVGRFCRLEPLDTALHCDELYEAFSDDSEGKLWTYMAVGPFESLDQFRGWIETVRVSADPQFYAIVDTASGKAVGVSAFMRIKPDVGLIEVGSISYSPRLQRTPQATEAMFLMMSRVFDELGYRRYEWKCDSLNAPSRHAAQRLGFSFEGIFAQALVYKGRNRDTAWYALLDRDWLALKRAYLAWLDPSNFNAALQQKVKLQDFIIAQRSARQD